LDLRRINTYPNGTLSRTISLSSFQAASHQIQSTLYNDFGDPTLNRSANEEIEGEGHSAESNPDHEQKEDSQASRTFESGGGTGGFETRNASLIPVEGDKEVCVYSGCVHFRLDTYVGLVMLQPS
jgi:hypothetical protein